MQTLSEWLTELADGLEFFNREKAAEARAWAERLRDCVLAPIILTKPGERWCAKLATTVSRRYGDTATEAFANLQRALMREE